MKNNENRFVAPVFTNHSPLTWYQAASEQPAFIRDAAQAKAIEYLDKLWTELMMFKRKRNRFLGRSLRSPQLPKGLYFYGGVGLSLTHIPEPTRQEANSYAVFC